MWRAIKNLYLSVTHNVTAAIKQFFVKHKSRHLEASTLTIHTYPVVVMVTIAYHILSGMLENVVPLTSFSA